MTPYSLTEKNHGATENDNISESLVTVMDPSGVAAAAYHHMRANLFHKLAGTSSRVFLITSPGFGEGKSSVCANLGVVLAQAGKNTLVLDCDLRRPTTHEIFGLRNTHGMVDVLLGERKLEEVCQQPFPTLDLKVLTVGPLPPNPAAVLGSQNLSKLLDDVRGQFDCVLVDSSPANVASDVTVLAAQADGVLLVLDAQSSRKADVWEAMRILAAVGANIIGTVMNNAKRT